MTKEIPTPFTILRIDASARQDRSLTRNLADRFIDTWRARWPRDVVLTRDVGLHPPPAISEKWIAAAFAENRTLEQQRTLQLSDALIAELRAAHLLVIATPMYNYGMPASLKAWLDQVVRVNETFTFDLSRGDWPLEPVLSGKRLVLLTASGEFGFAPGGPRAHMDHLTPHLCTVRHYLGAQEILRVAIEYQELADDRHRQSVADAREEVVRVVERLSRERSDASASAAPADAPRYSR